MELPHAQENLSPPSELDDAVSDDARPQAASPYEGIAPHLLDADQWQPATQLLTRLTPNSPSDLPSLPVPARLPWPRNPYFSGRDAELRQLAELFSATSGEPPNVAMTGPGGIGKSQLALEFAYRYGRLFAGGVFWIDCSRPEQMASEVGACAAALSVAASGEQAQVAEALAAWQSPLPRLLIFDNCGNDQVLSRWRPPVGGCRVLLTARRSAWPSAQRVRSIMVGPLVRDESMALLRRFRPDLAASPKPLAAVAEKLADWPLALLLAGRYLVAHRSSPEGDITAYLEAIENAGTEPPEASVIAEGYLAPAFRVSVSALNPAQPADALARTGLERAACLMPGVLIPDDLLTPLLAGRAGEATGSVADEALARLEQLGLLERSGLGGGWLQRPVAQLAFANLVTNEVFEQTAGLLLGAAELHNAAGETERLKAWQAHLAWVARTAARRHSRHSPYLYNELGYHARLLKEYARARQYHERAVELGEGLLGSYHAELITWYNNLGRVLKAQGESHRARAQLERALVIGKQVLGANHADVATLHNNLGLLLHELGNLTEAGGHYERALAIGERTLAADDPVLAIRHSNLGSVLHDLGDLTAARIHLHRAVKLSETAWDTGPTDLAQCHSRLGQVLRDLGESPLARSAFERALSLAQRALGAQHPGLVPYHDELGRLLHQQRALPEARAHFERALALYELAHPSDQSEAATLHSNLGSVLHDLGELAAARGHFERTLAIDQQTLEPNHPRIGSRHNQLCRVLHDFGELAEAAAHLEQAVRIGETAPEQDPLMLSGWHNNLGRVLYEAQDPVRAHEHFQRALALGVEALGVDHPTIATLEANVALAAKGISDQRQVWNRVRRSLGRLRHAKRK